jgi:PAS domain S-box-containing protein
VPEKDLSNDPVSIAIQIDELQQLYEQAPCGYHSLDKHGVFVRINQTELAMLGYSREELIGNQKFSELLTPQSQEKFATHFPLLEQNGVWRDLEFEMIRRDRSILYVSISATAINDAAGNYMMSRSVMVDISERVKMKAEGQRLSADHRQVELELHEAHERMVTAWESMTDSYTFFDLEWRITYLNQAAINIITQLTNLKSTEILGKTHWEISPELTGGDLERCYRQAMIDQVPAHFEERYEPTGSWFEIHAYPSPLGLGVYFRDISDRKAAEEQILRTEARLRYLLSSNPAVLYACQASGDYGATFISENVVVMLGYESSEFLADSQFWASRIHPEDAPEVFAGLPHLFAHGTHTHEYRFLHQNGSYRWVQDELRLVRNAAGEPLEIVGYWIDVTDRKQLEAQFLRAQRIESLGMLAGGIAHDLNNVLTPIIGIVQLLPLKIPNLDPKTQRLLQILDESAHRGSDLVKQILSFTRGVEGKPTNIQVGHILTETQNMIREALPRNIQVAIELSENLLLVAADGTLLHQVFMNLCVNARDAMPDGGTLKISAENLEIDENYARMHIDAQVGSYVVVTIADTGMGIPRGILDRIFDPFFTTKEAGKGTGLGLSTVMSVIKSHRGFINIYSEVGKGTEFKVYLPAIDLAETPQTPKPEVLLGKNELILVVDDEVAVQEVTKATLEAHGYRAMIASDGIEAIALYAEQKQNISVVLLDLMMPSLDSMTIIRTLCKLNPQVRIIAMSGLATNESVTISMRAEVQAFLAKPFTASELLDHLARICSQ